MSSQALVVHTIALRQLRVVHAELRTGLPDIAMPPLITLSPRACHSDRLVSELLLTALTCQQAQLGVHTGVADVFTPVFTPAFTPESPAIHTLTWHSFTPQFTPHRRRREHVFTAPVCSHRSRRRSGIAELTSHIVPRRRRHRDPHTHARSHEPGGGSWQWGRRIETRRTPGSRGGVRKSKFLIFSRVTGTSLSNSIRHSPHTKLAIHCHRARSETDVTARDCIGNRHCRS